MNKSLESQLDLLHSLKRNEYDLCLIQEPYIDFNGKTRANQNWVVIYPSTHSDYPDHTRSVILINTSIISDAWKQIHFNHPDITVIGPPRGSDSGNVFAHANTTHRHLTSLRTRTNLREHHETSTNFPKPLRSYFAALRTTSHDFAALRTPSAAVCLSYRPSDSRGTPPTCSRVAIRALPDTRR
jgi:hypothetical protein